MEIEKGGDQLHTHIVLRKYQQEALDMMVSKKDFIRQPNTRACALELDEMG